MTSTISSGTEAALLARIRSTLDRIDAKTVELRLAVDSGMRFVPPPLRNRVAAGWPDFCALMRRIWDNLTTILSNMGSPYRLYTTANAWSDRVGVPVSGQVQTAEAGLLLVDDNWDGDAADAYRQMLPLQKAALDKIKSTITDGVSTALMTVAAGIVAFWAGLVGAATALAVGILGALSSTATIIGMPAAPFIACGAAATACVSMIGAAEVLKALCSTANSTLRQKFDDTGFHGGHWPPAVRG
ncbi:hypothetical protein [Actinoplanes aureus]|uniref:Uncharacterized protein n=1 Tax=Actinoplanes aureus TaxID=2792083 RepID=A0A931CB07_9ACTN|nr:hypothetical protein [Actinoplanes aureus]MBG0564097.1 hypothetical protein [Actinoplanes aureus]